MRLKIEIRRDQEANTNGPNKKTKNEEEGKGTTNTLCRGVSSYEYINKTNTYSHIQYFFI